MVKSYMYSEITLEYMNSHKVIAYKIFNFIKNTTEHCLVMGIWIKKAFSQKLQTSTQSLNSTVQE